MRISDWSSDVCSSDLDAKYGFRDYRGGGRSSARETAARVAAGAVARAVIPEVRIPASLVELGGDAIDRAAFDDAEIDRNPFRSAERRVGKQCVSTCRSRGSLCS